MLRFCPTSPFSSSDHRIVHVQVNFGQLESKDNFCRRWFQGSYLEITDCLSEHDWITDFARFHNVSDMYALFSDVCINLIDLFIPFKKVSTKVNHCLLYTSPSPRDA